MPRKRTGAGARWPARGRAGVGTSRRAGTPQSSVPRAARSHRRAVARRTGPRRWRALDPHVAGAARADERGDRAVGRARARAPARARGRGLGCGCGYGPGRAVRGGGRLADRRRPAVATALRSERGLDLRGVAARRRFRARASAGSRRAARCSAHEQGCERLARRHPDDARRSRRRLARSATHRVRTCARRRRRTARSPDGRARRLRFRRSTVVRRVASTPNSGRDRRSIR